MARKISSHVSASKAVQRKGKRLPVTSVQKPAAAKGVKRQNTVSTTKKPRPNTI